MTEASRPASFNPTQSGLLRRKCDCGLHTGGGECAACKKESGMLHRYSDGATGPAVAPPIVHDVLGSSGKPLDPQTQAYFGAQFGADFSQIRVYTDSQAAESARAVRALAYTVGQRIVFATNQYSPSTTEGKALLGHELAHSRQQTSTSQSGAMPEIRVSSDPAAEQSADAAAEACLGGRPVRGILPQGRGLNRRAGPFIKKVAVHLTPQQSADLQWEGSPPSDAPGQDHFTVSTGKGYSDPDDPAGTCTRSCCDDPNKQCAPPWNQPGRVGACCTYFGNDFWTGTPLPEHNTWKWWTPIQPFYSSRGIALHAHPEVTGEPIGHGCVRMEEANAKRIHDFSDGKRTKVTIDGRAAPVKCEEARKCDAKEAKPAGGPSGQLDVLTQPMSAVAQVDAVPGLEGTMS